MARDISTRLAQLQTRRKGTDRLESLAMEAQADVLAKSYLTESWQGRAKSQPFTRYALGAMQEVGTDYTRISIETAKRVGNQLDNALTAAGYLVDFRLQGSVPLNVHIRGISDVDLLNLDTSFLTYHSGGPRGNQYSSTPKTSLGVLISLRNESEKILKLKFPAAKVDCSGNKAIKISGGSLARPVDVVPSHWNDNIQYQSSSQEHDRGVTILDKGKNKTIENLPFLHIKLVTDRDASTLGGLKKAIRLCKNVKSDSDKNIALASFDITSTMYHANTANLLGGHFYELAILGETQRHLDFLHSNKEYAKTLKVPDGSRFIFDTPEKLTALTSLSIELDELLRDVAKEHNASLAAETLPSLEQSRGVVASAYVPS